MTGVAIAFSANAQTAVTDNPLPDWAFGGFVRPEGVNPIISPNETSVFNCPMKGEEVKWECADTFNPAAVVKDGKIYILYRAEDDPKAGIGGRTSRIGLAESSDGITIDWRSATPVFYPDATEISKTYEWKGGCEDPRVVAADIDGKTVYVMTYTSWNNSIPRLSVATSENLTEWTKYGPAFLDAYEGKYKDLGCKSGSIVTEIKNGRQVAAKVNGKYLMYWGETAVYLASSDDLIHWTPLQNQDGKLLELIKPRKGYFDSNLTECGPPAIITENGILLFYNGKNDGGSSGCMDYPGSTYAAGQVLFDINEPTKVIGRLDNAFFRPMEAAEKSGQYKDGTVFIEGLVYKDGKWYLYYGCADSKVGVAVYDPAVRSGYGDPIEIETADSRVLNAFPRYGNGKSRCIIKSYSSQTGDHESPFYLNTGSWLPNKKWCDNQNQNPWVIFEFFDYYTFDGFGFDDACTHEASMNTPEYWLYVSDDGENWGEPVLHMSGVGDQNVKEETFAPVEGRFVKAVFTKADNAVRIYGCRIYGEYSRPFVREGSDVVSIGKTVMKSYDCANERESALNLINGVYEKSGGKWCFFAADINNDPIKFVVIDLEDQYSVNKFTIYDCKLHENNNNLDHYKISIATERPDVKLVTPSGDSNTCWTEVVNAMDVNQDEKTHEHVLNTPVSARYVKLEVPRVNVDGDRGHDLNHATSRVYAFDVHGQAIQTGIGSIIVPTVNAQTEYFDLQGRKVRNPQSGLYIRRQGDKVSKVFVL